MPNRTPVDPRLDYLYNRNVKCPYCRTRILKYAAVCTNCGVHKKQIAESSNKSAKYIRKHKTGEQVLMTRSRPMDVRFTVMVLWLLLGLFGAHNFYVGRKIRGWIMVGCFVTTCLFFFIFPTGNPLDGFTGQHSWRAAFDGWNVPFPTDWFFIAGFIMWAYDAFAVVFGFYKYPVRLGEAPLKVSK